MTDEAQTMDQNIDQPTDTSEVDAAEVQAENPEGEAETPAERAERYRIKVDGREVEVDHDQLVSGFQKAHAADKKFMEAAEYKKYADQIVSQFQQLQQNPAQLVNLLGEENFVQMAEQLLYKKYSRDEMSPEQRELEELREYRRQQDEARKKSEEEQKLTKEQEQVNQYRESFQKRFDTILEGMKWPKSPETVARMARYYQAAAEKGYEPSDRDIQDFLEKNYSSELKGLFSNVSVDKLYQMIGEDGLKALRSYDLQKVRGPKQVSSQGGGSPQRERGGKARSLEQVLEEARHRAGL